MCVLVLLIAGSTYTTSTSGCDDGSWDAGSPGMTCISHLSLAHYSIAAPQTGSCCMHYSPVSPDHNISDCQIR